MARLREVEPDANDFSMVERVLDYVHVQSPGRDLRIGLLGLDEDNNLCYLRGGYEYDDGREQENSPTNMYCGLSSNFLSTAKTSHKPPVRRHKKTEPIVLTTNTYSAETHSKLLEDEEKSKEKARKKRIRKLRQRERKRVEKLDKQKLNDVKIVEVDSDALQPNAAAGKGVHKEFKQPNHSSTGARGKQGTSKDSASSGSDVDLSEKEQSDGENLSEESEEELDLNSCFVSKAVDIAKLKLELKPKPENKTEKKNNPTPARLPKTKPIEGQNELKEDSKPPTSEDLVKISTDLAGMGNRFASSGDFNMAVKYFTDAIKYNPQEYRLFGNRSFCFERMQEYERALADAELSLNMCPGWVKGLYRKGRALAGLQRYDEASHAFKEVLQLNSSCVDAAQELMRVQIIQLMEFGFSREQSSNALIIHGTVKKALEALSKISGVTVLTNGSNPTTVLPIRVANESRTPAVPPPSLRFQAPKPPLSQPQPQPQSQSQPQPQHQPQPQTQPTPVTQLLNNPAKRRPETPQAQPELFPIWVGNLVQTITESMIKNLFSIVGDVHSVKLLQSKRCAFVNFTNQKQCDTAIHKFHGHELHGTRVTVRYPDRLPSHLGLSRSAHQAVDLPENSQNAKECFFWRNMGCSRRPTCPFKHILDHKGVDRRKTNNTEE